jgi:hypothetical protein
MPAVELLEFVKVCAIVFPEPLLAPVMMASATTVHVKVAGAVEVICTLLAVLLQMACGAAVISGVGLTVTITVLVAGHEPVVVVAEIV